MLDLKPDLICRAFRYWCRALFKHDAFHGSKGHKCSTAMRYSKLQFQNTAQHIREKWGKLPAAFTFWWRGQSSMLVIGH